MRYLRFSGAVGIGIVALTATAFVLGLALLARIRDMTNETEHYTKTIHLIAVHLHESLMKDEAYRWFNTGERLREITPILNIILPKCVKLFPEDHRQHPVDTLFKNLSTICSKD